MAQELTLVRGVDRDLHRAELQRGKEGDDLLGRVLEQRRDPVALADAPRRERMREPVARHVHLPGRERHALEVEIGAVGVGIQPVRERGKHRGLLRQAHGG